MTRTFEYELFWNGELIGRLVNAEPDVPYVEGELRSNGSDAALRFDVLLKELFAGTDNVNWTQAPQIEVLHSNGHRSKGYVTGADEKGLLIRW